MPKSTSVVLASLFLGLWTQTSTRAADRPASPGTLRVAVYDDTGTSHNLPWARGTGLVDVALTAKGRELLGVEPARTLILYYQGPLLAPADDPKLPDYEVLGRFDGEIAKKGAPTGVMKGTTAIAAAPFESGRVLCISPHPERTDNLHDMVYRALLWVTRR